MTAQVAGLWSAAMPDPDSKRAMDKQSPDHRPKGADRDRKGTVQTDETKAKSAEREARLAEALRANLRRRKAPNPSDNE